MKTAPVQLDLDQARNMRRVAAAPGWLNAVAACLVVAVATVAGYAGGRTVAPAETFTLAGVVESDGWLDDSLTSVASGETRAHGPVTFKAVATYLGDDGQVCREIEVAQHGQVSGAVACRNEAAWEVRMAALLGPEVSAAEFRPASAGATDALSIVLDEISAGDALGAQDEQCLIEQDWMSSASCVADQ